MTSVDISPRAPRPRPSRPGPEGGPRPDPPAVAADRRREELVHGPPAPLAAVPAGVHAQPGGVQHHPVRPVPTCPVDLPHPRRAVHAGDGRLAHQQHEEEAHQPLRPRGEGDDLRAGALAERRRLPAHRGRAPRRAGEHLPLRGAPRVAGRGAGLGARRRRPPGGRPARRRARLRVPGAREPGPPQEGRQPEVRLRPEQQRLHRHLRRRLRAPVGLPPGADAVLRRRDHGDRPVAAVLRRPEGDDAGCSGVPVPPRSSSTGGSSPPGTRPRRRSASGPARCTAGPPSTPPAASPRSATRRTCTRASS